MVIEHDRFHVVTGGPGSGKTSLLDELEARGIARTVEAGRAIIRDQLLTGGNALPWGDRALFAELMLSSDMRSYETAKHLQGPVVFDRGIPDVVGYLRLCALPVPAHVEAAARRLPYAPVVFLAPYWAEIFTRDAERKQDPDEALRTCEIMAETYAAFGYSIVELPFASVEARADFVMERLGIPPVSHSRP